MKTRKQMRQKRTLSIRHKIRGRLARPRLTVLRSNTRLAVQLIDDEKARTLLSHSVRGKNIEAAKQLGAVVANDIRSKKISSIVFDRSGYRYHGAVKALVEAIREGGITV